MIDINLNVAPDKAKEDAQHVKLKAKALTESAAHGMPPAGPAEEPPPQAQ